jgi:hypothetical protein
MSAPVTDSPVDSGFPTAQVRANSLGSGDAYAPFPDPGAFAHTAPGLVVDLLAQGGSGLPPIHLPSPGYPLSVHAVRGVTPEQNVGQGPYAISASSQDASTSASATGGLSLGGAGRTSGLASSVSITQDGNGNVITEATSDLQGLAVGPLTIGRVTSSAWMTLATDGTVARARHVQIDGYKSEDWRSRSQATASTLREFPCPQSVRRSRRCSIVVGRSRSASVSAPRDRHPARIR